MKILVRSPNWVGDQILAYPFFYFLRHAFPEAKITAVTVPWVQDLQFRSLVDEVVVLKKPLNQKFKTKLDNLNQTGRLLKAKGPFDLAISLPNSLSSAYLIWQANSKIRKGYSTDGRFLFLNHRLKWNKVNIVHRAQAYVDLLESSVGLTDIKNFWGVLPDNDLDEGLSGELIKFDYEKEWKPIPADILEPPKNPYYVLAPGATAEARRWMPESFLSLAKLIRSETGMKGIIIGGASEVGLGMDLSADPSAGLMDWTGRTSIPGLSKVFSNAKFVISNESGLAHVASLLGAFTQIVCGAANPARTRPLGPGRVQIALNPVDCWPCERNHCSQIGMSFLQCLRGIEAETVWTEIKRGLNLPNKVRVYG